MGKRKLAATIKGFDHSTDKSCYSSQGIAAHLRGWDHGIIINVTLEENDVPIFEIYKTNGSNNPKAGELLYVYEPAS